MDRLVYGRILPRGFYYNLIIRLVLITCTSFGLALTIVALPEEYLILTINLFILLLLEVLTLYRYIIRFDSDISRFLINIKHNEYSDHISSANKKRGFDKFRSLLNEMNEIIEQKSMEIQENEILFKRIITLSPGALIVFLDDGKVRHVNPAALKLFGIINLLRLKDLDAVAKDLGQTIEKMDNGVSLRKSFDSSSSSLVESKLSLVLHKVAFITDRERLYILSIQDIRTVEINQEMESWQKIIRVIRHEIMNSLSPIPALVGSLKEQISDNNGNIRSVDYLDNNTLQRVYSGLDTISSSSKSLLSFISKYRQLTSLPQIVMQPTDINDLIKSCIAQFDPGKDNMNFSITFVPDNSIKQIRLDSDLIRMALSNIIKNAIESIVTEKPGKIVINIGSHYENLSIAISDNGKGIPEEVRDNIFIPFFTTKDAGSGIGLSISRQIIAMHSGRLVLLSSSESGTVFKIIIPYQV